ncbi:MAG TPA: hypothetical protein VH724_11055 [Candidatus Angelobacter sp.]|jgi:hypothetical protein|nr:hypothetical protein [Candidatus Angelobacter sp.]
MAQLIANERGRRSSRVLVSLALAVSGQKSDGSHVSGAAETILVNRHGAKIRSAVPLEPKMEVRVAMLAPYKWRVGQVVWADSGESEYGIELFRPENFWGIYFPPEDWELGIPAVTVISSEAHSGATQPRVEMKSEGPPAAPGPEPLYMPEGGTIAILRGIASNGLPFQERDLILPVGERDATMLIGPLVSLGSKLQVIFSKNCVEDATVTATSHSREYDRWRIWLNFSRVLLVAKQ